MKSMRSIFVCAALLVWAGAALGATRYVQGIGKPNHPTIQAALDAAGTGDEIRVAPGTYHETINFNGKAVRLYSAGAAAVTIIDGTGLSGPVVTCNQGETPTTVLDGFTITGGNADEGGGMYNSGSSPTVTDCTFRGNSASGSGGGMCNQSSSPTVTDCTFSGNSAGAGGGMYNENYGRPTATHLTHCTFSGNSASDLGGGMFNYQGSRAVVSNCTFSDNTGGAVFNVLASSLTATNCVFNGNSGHAIATGEESRSTLINCVIRDNSGIGMSTGGFSDGIAINCTFSGNAGGGVGGAFTTVINSILWSDPGGELLGPDVATTVTYSDIQGGFAGEGNINADPLFDANLGLQAGSPCIDAGSSAAVPEDVTTDLDGKRRIQGTGVDMGAYESPHKVKKIKP
jgi:parallel beta-helix repeat protein